MNIEKRRKRVQNYTRRKRRQRYWFARLMWLALSAIGLGCILFAAQMNATIPRYFAPNATPVAHQAKITFYSEKARIAQSEQSMRQADAEIALPRRTTPPLIQTFTASKSQPLMITTTPVSTCPHRPLQVNLPKIPEPQTIYPPQQPDQWERALALRQAKYNPRKPSHFPPSDPTQGFVTCQVTLNDRGVVTDLLLLDTSLPTPETAQPILSTLLTTKGTTAARGIITYNWYIPKPATP